MGGCLSQVGSQVMGWQVTSTTHLSDPNLQFPVRSVLRRAGPTLFIENLQRGATPPDTVARIPPRARTTGRQTARPGPAGRAKLARPGRHARKHCPPAFVFCAKYELARPNMPARAK